MNDHDAIVALIHEYAYRLDIGDLDGVAELFANAELRSTRHDVVRKGAQDARALYDGVIIYDDGTPRTMHQLTNVTITVDGDAASARTYFTVLGVLEDGLRPILAGEYRDRFGRGPGGAWEFRARLFDPKLFGDLSMHMKSAAPSMEETE
jgi:ketosteroid isomerase-like protein